jgi:hypothetical protein
LYFPNLTKVVKRSVDEEGDKDADPEPTDELAAIDAEKEQKAETDEKPFEEMTQLGEILQYPKSFSKRMDYFPYIWIGLFSFTECLLYHRKVS